MRQSFFRVAAIAILLQVATSPMPLLAGSPSAPVAIDALASVGLIVLGAQGTLYRLTGKGGDYNGRNIFYIPSGQYPADMTLAEIDGNLYIFVSSNSTAEASGFSDPGRITQYTLEGRPLNHWRVHGVCAGIDYDPSSRTLYVATSDQNEVFSIDVGGDSLPKSIATIHSATRVGPLAYDGLHKRLFVGDIESGGVYALSLASRQTTVLLSSKEIGDTTALKYDAVSNKLYAGDSRRHDIAVLDPDSRSGVVRGLITGKLIRPTGITLTPDRNLAVSDYEQHAIIFFSPNDGRLIGIRELY